jgi:predicted transcriptional regulator
MRAYFRDYFAARALLRGRTPLWMVDARPVAAHLARLTASGWTYRKIAAEAGCSPQTLANLVHRARRRGEARCWNITARGVLALRART